MSSRRDATPLQTVTLDGAPQDSPADDEVAGGQIGAAASITQLKQATADKLEDLLRRLHVQRGHATDPAMKRTLATVEGLSPLAPRICEKIYAD